MLQTDDSITIIFSSTLENVDDVCTKTMAFLQSARVDMSKHLFAINLVIREGLTNAVRHGNAGAPDKWVRFVLTVEKQQAVKIIIEDQGNGFNWKKRRAMLPEDTEDHGRGVAIMDMYFTKYYYNDKGNILYLEKDITGC